MILNFMSPWVFAVGSAALLAGLFAMQRLRVRHRSVVVPTTLFWTQAIDEAQARIFKERFRHPWAFLLIACIALLIWLAAAGPETGSAEGDRHIVLLDRGASASNVDHWVASKALVLEQAVALPESARWVFAVGASPRLILDRSESSVLLEKRLDELEPEPVHGSLRDAVLALQREHADAGSLTFHIVGGGTLPEGLQGELAPNVELRRLTSPSDLIESNSGIVALGSGIAESGAWGLVDVFIRIDGANSSDRQVRVTLDGEVVTEVLEVSTAGADRILMLRDQEAAGGLVRVELTPGDDLSADDSASLVLPTGLPLQVYVDPSAQASLRAVVTADAGLALSADRAGADVVLGGAVFEGVPQLLVSRQTDGSSAFQFTRTSEENPEAFLEFVLGHLSLGEIDAMGLAQDIGAPVGVAVAPGAVRRVVIWEELLDPELDLFHSRTLPIFIGRSLRWLARRRGTPTHVIAGEVLAGATGRYEDASGHFSAGTREGLILPVAGVWTRGDGTRLAASVADTSLTSAPVGSKDEIADILSPSGPVWLSVIGALVLALLALEWFLLSRERIP